MKWTGFTRLTGFIMKEEERIRTILSSTEEAIE
jgi:hypothetical protein